MKISFLELVQSVYGPKDAKFRRRLYIFLVCLVISVIIWFSIKLANNYNTVIEMPVAFTNIPKNKVLTSVSDSILHVEVVEKGSDLFRMQYLLKPKSATINLRFLPLYHTDGVYRGIVIPSLFINEIEHEHDLMGKIISIRPDTLYLTLENQKATKVPVKATFDLSYEKQYTRFGEITFEPDSVVVKGPARIIEYLDTAYLGAINLSGLNASTTIEKSFEKDTNYQFFEFDPSTITVTIPVEKYTESEAIADIQVINSGENNIKTFPDKVTVSYKIALKDFSMIEPGMLKAVADFSSVNISEEDKVRIRLENCPPYITINKIEPEKVEFIILK